MPVYSVNSHSCTKFTELYNYTDVLLFSAPRYTLPDGSERLMNIVGKPGRTMTNFMTPYEYVEGTLSMPLFLSPMCIYRHASTYRRQACRQVGSVPKPDATDCSSNIAVIYSVTQITLPSLAQSRAVST